MILKWSEDTSLGGASVSSATLDDATKKITLTMSDGTTTEIDLTDLYTSLLDNKNVSSATLDNANKKIVLTLTNNSTIDIDLTDIYNSIDTKIPIPATATENDVAIFDNNKGVKDALTLKYVSDELIANGTAINKYGIDINKEGSEDKVSFLNLYANANVGTSITREYGIDGKLNISQAGQGAIYSDSIILEYNGHSQMVHGNSNNYAGNNKKPFCDIANVNDLHYQGTYNIHSTFVANLPMSGWGYITVKVHSNTTNRLWITQEYESMGAGNRAGYKYIRNCVNGVWDIWSEVTITKAILLDTLQNVAPFANGWTSYGGEWDPVITKKADGIVYINGLVKGGKNNTVVCKLPNEYKPVAGRSIISNCMCTKGRYQRVDVLHDGRILVRDEGERSNASQWIALDFTYQAGQ